MDSEIKFAVAHVSNKARHLISFRLRSRMYINALVNNWGLDSRDIDVRLVALSGIESASHSVCVFSDFVVFDLFITAYLSRCKSVLCRFWQIVQLENLQGVSRWDRKQL